MWKLLNQLFLEDKPHPKGDELYGNPKVEAVVSAIKQVAETPKRNIGEPVLSLVKSILETDDWVLSSGGYSVGMDSLHATHVRNQKLHIWWSWWDDPYGRRAIPAVKFYADWMTDAEKQYMIELLPQFIALKERREEEARVKRNNATRERFMRELVDHHGQLELQLN